MTESRDLVQTHDILFPADSPAVIFAGRVGVQEVVEVESLPYIVAPDGSVGVSAKSLGNFIVDLEPETIIWIRPGLSEDPSPQDIGNRPIEEVISLVDGSVEIDYQYQELRLDSKPVHLRPKEFDLIGFLGKNRRQILTRRQILEGCWDNYWCDPRIVDVYVSILRKKLGEQKRILRTVRGIGYILDDRALPAL